MKTSETYMPGYSSNISAGGLFAQAWYEVIGMKP
jgi:hypothetical protein